MITLLIYSILTKIVLIIIIDPEVNPAVGLKSDRIHFLH